MADFFHRVEVRDITGHCNSILFTPDEHLDWSRLRKGSTVFVRYAAKAYFSDLMTQVRGGTGWCRQTRGPAILMIDTAEMCISWWCDHHAVAGLLRVLLHHQRLTA